MNFILLKFGLFRIISPQLRTSVDLIIVWFLGIIKTITVITIIQSNLRQVQDNLPDTEQNHTVNSRTFHRNLRKNFN